MRRDIAVAKLYDRRGPGAQGGGFSGRGARLRPGAGASRRATKARRRGLENVAADRRHLEMTAKAAARLEPRRAGAGRKQHSRGVGRRPQLSAGRRRARQDRNRARSDPHHAPLEVARQSSRHPAVSRRQHQDGVRGAVAPNRHQFRIRQGSQERRQDHDLRATGSGRAGHRTRARPKPARAAGAGGQHGDDLSRTRRSSKRNIRTRSSRPSI